MTHERIPPPEPVGLVLHAAWRYDLQLWLMSRGREHAFREELVDLARLSPGESVLDVGCGTGTLAVAAKRRIGPSGAVYGIDPSVEMIGRARTKAHKARVTVAFETAAAQAIPFPDGMFDAVLCTFVLHQLPPGALHEAVGQMRRVLKPGGRLFLVDIGGPQDGRQTFHVRRASARHIHLFDLAEALPLLDHLGLAEIDRGEIAFRLSRFERVRYVLATAPTNG